jgi:hypothetical protein
MVEAKEVVVLEIRFLDSNSQMTHSNNSHIEEVEEANLKAGGGQRGRGNWNRQQSGSDFKYCHYCGKPGHWARECKKKESDMRNGRL